MKNNLKKIALLAALSSSVALNADFLKIEAGVSLDKPTISGYIQDSGIRVDLESDLALKSVDNQMGIWANFKHPIPLIPNVYVSYNKTDFFGHNTINKNITFGDFTYSTNTEVTTKYLIENTEIRPYYNVLDTKLAIIDLGLSLSQQKGYFEINGDRTDINIVVPLFVAKIETRVFPNTRIAYTKKYISDGGDNKIDQNEITLSMKIYPYTFIDVAYSSSSMLFEDDGTSADQSNEKTSIGVSYRF
jgi:outer membrane protein